MQTLSGLRNSGNYAVAANYLLSLPARRELIAKMQSTDITLNKVDVAICS